MINKKKVFFLIVLYGKKSLQQSKSYLSLLKVLVDGNFLDARRCEIIVWNNGPDAIDEQAPSFFLGGVNVINSIDNKPLAKVYNSVVSDCTKLTQSPYLYIFDDDTVVNEKCIRAGLESLDEGYCDIVLPKIFYSGKVVAPRYFTGEKIIDVEIREIASVFFTSVMSGVGISLEPFCAQNTSLFDEDYRFYGIDKEFFYQCVINPDLRVGFIPEGVEHGLSRFEGEVSNKKRRFRVKEQLVSDLVFAKKRNGLLSLIYYLKAFKLLIILCVLYVFKRSQ